MLNTLQKNTQYSHIKHSGQVYTPKYIVDNILDEAGYCSDNILEKHIIDNSCGDGVFLVAIATRYVKAYKNKYNKTDDKLYKDLKTYIHGIEIQKYAYDNCLQNLSNLALRLGLNNIECDVKNIDALDTVTSYIGQYNLKLDFSITSKLKYTYNNKMDYVIGNPPYVRVHNLGDSYTNVKKFSFAKNGMTDLYIVFFEIGFNMLNSNGKMCLISPSSYLHSNAGSNLREYIKNNNNLKLIIDLGHFQPFNNITTYTAISLFENGKSFLNLDYYKYDSVKKNKYKKKVLSYKNIFINNKIFLATKSTLITLVKISNNKINRVDVKNGFATLADGIFIGNFSFNGLVIDILKASTGNYYKCIFPYDNNGKPITIKDLKKNKNTYNYLLSNKEELCNRSIKNKNDWYLFGRSQGINDTGKDKIAINTLIKNVGSIRLNKIPKGCATYSGLYILTNTPFEKIKNIIKTNEFIVYIKSLKKYKNGGYYTFSSKDLERYLNYKLAL